MRRKLMIMNKERGEIERLVGKVLYIARPTHDAMSQIEGATGRGICEVASNALHMKCSSLEIAAILFYCIKAANNDAEPKNLEAFHKAVFKHGVLKLAGKCVPLLNTMVSGETEAESAEKKPSSTDTDTP